MRGARTGAYNRRVEEMPRLLVSGHFNSTDLTNLDDLAAPRLGDLPGSIQRPLRAAFWETVGEPSFEAPGGDDQARAVAATELAARTGELIEARLDIAYDAERIESMARNCAKVCRYFSEVGHAKEFCEARGVVLPPETATSTGRGRLLRLRCHRWWRRQLAKAFGRRAENGLRRAGVIRRQNQLYASDLAVRGRRQQKAITDRWFKERVVVSDGGAQCELWDIVQASQSNPALRRAELMTRMRGFEEVAEAAGHLADFWTLTTPSAFHKMNADGRANPRYTGASVRDAQQWLTKMWAKARAKLKRLKVLIYGFRIAEPHHDATPHWHMVLFCPPHHRGTVRTVLTGYWLSVGGDDPGARDHRITVKAIDEHKGTAAGYLAKYVAKNIDGFQVGADHEADDLSVREVRDANRDGVLLSGLREQNDATTTCERVTTWASRHGIRQFQQIGGPPVTVWRELRRIRTSCLVVGIEAARVHADAGDWAEFVRVLGGIEKGRGTGVQLWSELTGEINQYDEMRGPQIVGVAAADGEVKTRISVWRIEKRSGVVSTIPVLKSSSPLGPVTITVRSESGVGSPSAWSNPNETSMYGPH